MKVKLDYAGLLYYADGIQLFEARDEIGGHYIGVAIQQNEEGHIEYAVVGIRPRSLQLLRLGKVDLRTAMLESERHWLIGTIELDEGGKALVSAQPQLSSLPEEYLPDADFYLELSPNIDPEGVVIESRSRNRLAFELSLEAPVGTDEHRLSANVLSGALVHLQSFFKHAYRKVTGALRGIDRELASRLDVVVPARSGSFKIVFVPTLEPDLFSQSEISKAIVVLDYFLADSADPEKTLARVREYSGHAAGAFVRLIRFVSEQNLALTYSWTSPEKDHAEIRHVTTKSAATLLGILSATSSLNVESITLTGALRKVDVDTGTWRLRTDLDAQEHSGKSRPGITLAHLITDSRYTFHCEEEIEEVSGTGRETHTLYVTRVDPL